MLSDLNKLFGKGWHQSSFHAANHDGNILRRGDIQVIGKRVSYYLFEHFAIHKNILNYDCYSGPNTVGYNTLKSLLRSQ